MQQCLVYHVQVQEEEQRDDWVQHAFKSVGLHAAIKAADAGIMQPPCNYHAVDALLSSQDGTGG